jgi:hypothetical protein
MTPEPSDALIIKLASIAAHAAELIAADHQTEKAPVGLTTLKNERRRTAEAILVLLADSEVRDYLAELKRLDLVMFKR